MDGTKYQFLLSDMPVDILIATPALTLERSQPSLLIGMRMASQGWDLRVMHAPYAKKSRPYCNPGQFPFAKFLPTFMGAIAVANLVLAS